MEGFAAGTLAQTQQGLKPIESIAVGDLVLSQPQSTGERAYKRVARVVQGQEPIAQLYFWGKRDGKHFSQELLATWRHPVYVAGYHNNGGFSDEYWQELDKPIGWRRADSLEGHQLALIAGGGTMRTSSIARIWRTRKPGIGWIEANRDSSSMGRNVTVGGGRATGDLDARDDADFAGVEEFNARHETPELEAKWAYQCAVYSLEVEDFGTYYVGEHGIWVRS